MSGDLCNKGGFGAWFGHFKLLKYRSLVFYGQKHKVWLLVFLVSTSGTLVDKN